MKRNLISSLALALTLAAVQPATAWAQQTAPAQHIDLTVAAEKAVNSVVYIKVTINSRTQTIQ